MRGIKLNDIPMDLFLKYFSKEDLQDNYLDPKYVDEVRKVFKYTLSISSTTYYYYSFFNGGTTASNGPDYAVLRETIAQDFLDILPSITASSVTISSVDSGSDLQLYKVLGLSSTMAYRYVLEIYVDGSDNTIMRYPSISGGGLTNSINADLIESTNYTIKDDRSNSDSFGELVYLQASSNNDFYTVYLASDDSLAGYLFINKKSVVQDVNDQGELLYVNESGNDTTDSLRRSNFLRHSNAIRSAFFSRPTFEYLMSTTFQPGVISLLGSGREEYLVSYETFNRKIEMVEATFADTSGLYQNRLISTEIKDTIDGETVFTEIDNVTSVKYRILLDVVNTPKYEALETSTPFKYRTLSVLEDFKENDPIIVYVKKQSISLFDEEYPVIIESDGSIKLDISDSDFFDEGTYDLYLTENESGLFVSVPVYKGTIGNIRFPFEKKESNRVLIDGKTYGIYRLADVAGLLSYRIDIKVKRNTYDTSNVLIGSVKEQNGRFLDLRSLYIEENPINITDEFFDLTGFTENSSNNWSTTYYIRDTIDTNYFVQVRETLTKNTPTYPVGQTAPSFDQFLRNTHTRSQTEPTSGSYFLSKSGNYIKTMSPVNEPEPLYIWRSRFTSGDHYKSFNFSRGDIVRDDIIRNAKTRVIKQMNKEYLNKDQMDFYSISNILYDKDAHFKMRVFADSFLTVIENNNFSLPFNSKRNADISVDNLKNQISLVKFEKETPSINIRNYIESDFLDELMAARGEVSNLNGFQKLLEYDQIPNNDKRVKALYEQKKRETIFSNSDASQEVLDDLISYNKDINIKKVRKLDFKREILNIIKEFYFSSNSADSSDNFYINSYYDFYKEKIELASTVYSNNSSIVGEKSVFSRKYLILNDTRVQDLIEKVNTNTEDWRLM